MQNITISLTRSVAKKLKMLAKRRNTSMSVLLKEQIDVLFERDIAPDAAYGRAKRHALAVLEKGFRLGGSIRCNRSDWHSRRSG
jgi:hypothetical protein